jgi:hypothetical protein
MMTMFVTQVPRGTQEALLDLRVFSSAPQLVHRLPVHYLYALSDEETPGNVLKKAISGKRTVLLI